MSRLKQFKRSWPEQAGAARDEQAKPAEGQRCDNVMKLSSNSFKDGLDDEIHRLIIFKWLSALTFCSFLLGRRTKEYE